MKNYWIVLLASVALPGPFEGRCEAQQPKERASINAADKAIVRCVAFSPDGKTLASGGYEHTIKLWDVTTGKNIGKLEGNSGEIWSVAFSPDGKLLASASDTVKLWDVASGKNIATYEGHKRGICSVCFSPDGKTLASAGGGTDMTVKLWDIASGKNTATYKGHQGQITSVVFSPDGKILASASGTTIKLWDVANGKNTATFEKVGGGIWSVAFSPDSKTLASAEDGAARLWDVASGKNTMTLKIEDKPENPLLQTPLLRTGRLYSVAFSKDGRTLVSAGLNLGWIMLWDVATGNNLAEFRGHNNVVWTVAFSKDGKTFATGSRDRSIKIWEMSDDK